MNSPAGTADEVLSLCTALRGAKGLLGLTEAEEPDLLEHVARAPQAARATPLDLAGVDTQVRAIRYLLVEVADGGVSAFMADTAARILGDGIGRLFF
ncbi:hypothetical protein [Micromonospora inositola]|uniref:Uncharacterized protein n=1 Tax=Micromonospora inositola TaxID=47865 RepID=A0A1C5JGZ9_9ACTN|nr:hypothetical protein [Micromonospora inositola]SCG69864.1 hypothetical protein GA0070613_4677 [Micromonospora inositola]